MEQPRLVDRYLVYPASVIDRRSGRWRDLRARWDVPDDGRDGLLYQPSTHPVGSELHRYSRGTSRFDPALAHLLLHWYSRPGDLVIDPFAGGPVRGAVAHALDRRYVGVDIDPDLVARNQAACEGPRWEVGDAATWSPPQADLVLTCPPYGDLERYTDDPRDLSTMPWDRFVEALSEAVRRSVEALREDRYSVWVVSDIRSPAGELRDLPGVVVRAHQTAGATWLDDLVVVDPIGTARLRAKRPFVRHRRSLRTHQRVLVFLRGDSSRAAWRIYDHADTPDRAWAGPTTPPPP